MADSQPKTVKIGLVLAGGGARAAYQVGVLRALADITRYKKNPFLIISGFSAGAINGAWLGSRCENFSSATQSMWEAWASITIDKVFNINTVSLMGIALRWIKDRGLGGLQKNRQINYLLDTSPLDKFIRSHINFDNLNTHIEEKKLYGISIVAANYSTGASTAFYYGSDEIRDWKKLNRISIRTKIKPEYVLASAALPIFFQPVKIENSYYGDGIIRMHAPLSPAIHLGAEKLLVIGTNNPRRQTLNNKLNNKPNNRPNNKTSNLITVSEIAGTILNGLFFDSLDADIDRMQRINRTLSVMTEDKTQYLPDNLRKIPVLNIRPSEDLSHLTSGEMNSLPAGMSYLLRGLGVGTNKGVDLLSFLFFESKYTRLLLELGYEDTILKKDEFLNFFDVDYENENEILQNSPPMSPSSLVF